jgi:hypothetical protein
LPPDPVKIGSFLKKVEELSGIFNGVVSSFELVNLERMNPSTVIESTFDSVITDRNGILAEIKLSN